MAKSGVFYVKDLKVVGVIEYSGLGDGGSLWKFLGYDVVRTGEDGIDVSILADEEVKYKGLNYVYDSQGRRFIDHRGLDVGDVRIKVHSEEYFRRSFLGSSYETSVEAIKIRIEKQDYYFLYHNKEDAKVKTIGTKSKNQS